MCRWKQYELREQALSHVNYRTCLSSRVTGMVNVGISGQTCQRVFMSIQRLHVLALYTALHWRFICYFYSNWMEKIFPPSSVAMEASMLAVIHGHLFVLVCNESLKRVACPNWECLPFRHLYEPNDPGARVGSSLASLFFFFTIFSNLNCLPLSKGPPSRFKNIMANTFQCVRSLVVAKCQSRVSTTNVHLLVAFSEGPGNTKASNSSETSTSFPLPISIRGTTIWDG